jgi:hypothetical protein
MGGGSIIYQTKSLLLTSCAVSQILGCPWNTRINMAHVWIIN